MSYQIQEDRDFIERSVILYFKSKGDYFAHKDGKSFGPLWFLIWEGRTFTNNQPIRFKNGYSPLYPDRDLHRLITIDQSFIKEDYFP